ncbi:hypothetical protein BBO99_00008539 [Phytophthora kernoviae]|uniref:Uncharacterized protein n=1 Tax=Phytophthora kernoviae TaxID=325452 RepID=A0A3R7J6L4_9STRA|nr:hypothetical protein BBI17_008591 [Phytophthora kernoviae]RLN75116.1 hypothetical protein BBO99_00008539 [Phytophthora kernoviae]
MLDLTPGDETDEDVMGGVYHGAITAKLKQSEQWRLKPTITDVSVTTSSSSTSHETVVVNTRKNDKVKPKCKLVAGGHRMNPKDEVQYLRERVAQLEQTLEMLRLQALADKEKAMETAIVFNLVPQPDLLAPNKPSEYAPGTPESQSNNSKVGVGSPAAVDLVRGRSESTAASSDGLWERIATFQKEEYEKSMRQNKRLRTLAEQQLRALKQLEVAFRNPRAVSRVLQIQRSPEKLFCGNLFDSEAAIFDSLRVEQEAQYRQTNAIFQSAGLAAFEGDMACSAALRSNPGAKGGIFLENSECKVFPFSLDAVDHAVWHCLSDRNAEYHPGLYEVREVTDNAVAVKISDLVRLSDADTIVTVWLTVKRYYEWAEDGRKQVVCVWNAMVETEGSLNIRLQERGWNLLRSLTFTASCVELNRAMSFTQTYMRISPLGSAEFDARDVAVGTLANVLLGCYHRTIIVMHHILEKLLLVEDTHVLMD